MRLGVSPYISMMSTQHNACGRASKFFGWRKTTSLKSAATYGQGVSGGGFAAVERDCSEREASQNIPKRGGYEPEEHDPAANLYSRNPLVCFSRVILVNISWIPRPRIPALHSLYKILALFST